MKYDIDKLCELYNISNYTINSDGSIDVNGGVYFNNNTLTELPLKFNKVYGDFCCSDSNLTTLKNSPKYVNGHFDCSYNELTNLNFLPEKIKQSFDCSNNKLTSLKSNQSLVGCIIDCENNDIADLSEFNIKFESYFYCSLNPISVFGINGCSLEEIIDFKIINFIRNNEIIKWKFNLFYETKKSIPNKKLLERYGYKFR